jgi:hypothetical protein
MNFLGFLGASRVPLTSINMLVNIGKRKFLGERNWRILLGAVLGSFFSLFFLVLFKSCVTNSLLGLD